MMYCDGMMQQMNVRQRRFLPSLPLLMAFDGVMRCGGVTAAAAELSLTQSTVTRLIQSLEAQLGLPLFTRRNKRLVPTEAARRYHAEIATALDTIQRASMSLITNPEGGSLDLAVLPTLGTMWLAPRLPAFLAANPGISVNLTTRFSRFDFDGEPFDAMIYVGQGDWPGAAHLKLFEETLTACAAPSLLADHPVARAEDLHDLLLLQIKTRPMAWEAWFEGQSASPPAAMQSMWLDQFSMVTQAAISGLGVALLPDYLARIEIAVGRLHPLLREAVPGAAAYWLAWPESKDASRPLRAFRSWLATMV